jgi:hypothetical protein
LPGAVATLRAQSLFIGLVEHWAGRIAPMLPDTGRRRALYAAGRAVGERLHWAPELEPWAVERLTQAAHDCALIQTDGEKSALANLSNGLAAGLASPQALPDDQPGWTPATSSRTSRDDGPDAGGSGNAGADVIRAAAIDQLCNVPELVASLRDDDGRPVHPAARFTLKLLLAELLQRHVDTGRSTIEAGTTALALAIGRGPDAVRRAWPWIERAGWTIEPGGMGDDGQRWATRYTLQVENRQDAGDTLAAGGGAGAAATDGLRAGGSFGTGTLDKP